MTQALLAAEADERQRTGRARMCAVTRAVLPEAELIRFVASPDASIVPDLKARLPGRGVWIGAERKLVAEAVKRNVFARALHRQVAASAELPDQVAERLRAAALGRLGLACKAGAVVAGFAKVEAAIGNKPLAAIILAADAGDDGGRKIAQALHRRFGNELPVPLLRFLGSEELSLAIGRSNVIHAAVLKGPAGYSFVEAANRLQRYEGAEGGRDLVWAAEPAGRDE